MLTKLLSEETTLLSDLSNVDNITLSVSGGQAVGLLSVGVDDLPCLVWWDRARGGGRSSKDGKGGEDGEDADHVCLSRKRGTEGVFSEEL
jgi:hypothetical protein